MVVDKRKLLASSVCLIEADTDIQFSTLLVIVNAVKKIEKKTQVGMHLHIISSK